VVRALYLADSEQTAWAEWYRHSAELGVPPQSRLPRAVFAFEVNVADIADLTGPGVLGRHGIRKLSPSRRQWPRTQPIGEAYYGAGRRGLLAPSAAHVDGQVLVIFLPDADPLAGVTVRGSGRVHAELPALPIGLRT
jgi:RES domain-containing protein